MFRQNALSLVTIAMVSLSLGAAGVVAAQTSAGGQNLFPNFADRHTVALWLFDENQYPHTTLTDAGQYEYDLRLQKAGTLVTGKFGRALKVAPSSEMAVSYAGFKGGVPISEMRERNGTPSGLWGPTVAPEKILASFASSNWTCEFWLKLLSPPTSDVTIIDLGQAYEPGVTIDLVASNLKIDFTKGQVLSGEIDIQGDLRGGGGAQSSLRGVLQDPLVLQFLRLIDLQGDIDNRSFQTFVSHHVFSS